MVADRARLEAQGGIGMAPRSGSEFVEGLRRNPREVWVEGRRVDDVTADPVFRRPVQAIARLYDLQVSPEHRAAMTYTDEDTGELAGASFLMPRNAAELVKRRLAMGRCYVRPGRPFARLSQHRADDVRRERGLVRPARRAVRRQRAQLLQALPRPRPVPDARYRQSDGGPLQGFAPAGGPVHPSRRRRRDQGRPDRARREDAGDPRPDRRRAVRLSAARHPRGRGEARAGVQHSVLDERAALHLPRAVRQRHAVGMGPSARCAVRGAGRGLRVQTTC